MKIAALILAFLMVNELKMKTEGAFPDAVPSHLICYSKKKLKGEAISVTSNVGNLENDTGYVQDFSDTISSCSVTGIWILYDQPEFQGRINAIYGEDSSFIPSLSGNISSIRKIESSHKISNELVLFEKPLFQKTKAFNVLGEKEFPITSPIVRSAIVKGFSDWTIVSELSNGGAASSISVCLKAKRNGAAFFGTLDDKTVGSVKSIKQGCKGRVLNGEAQITDLDDQERKIEGMKRIPCPSGEKRHEDGVCRKCENRQYFHIDMCRDCNCDANGAKFQSCETGSGDCKCNIGYKDKKCNQCDAEFYKKTGEQDCKACLCDPRGSNGLNCNPGDGTCTCKTDVDPTTKCSTCTNAAKKLHVDGKCRECGNGKYKQGGTCKDCNCGTEGSKFQTCEDTSGQCDCKDGYEGRDCKTCKDKYYKITATGECKTCGCDSNGSQNSGKCAENSGDCTCKANFKPPKCIGCVDGYFYSQMFGGCSSCDCIVANTVGGDIKCDGSGRCNCKSPYTSFTCGT